MIEYYKRKKIVHAFFQMILINPEKKTFCFYLGRIQSIVTMNSCLPSIDSKRISNLDFIVVSRYLQTVSKDVDFFRRRETIKRFLTCLIIQQLVIYVYVI